MTDWQFIFSIINSLVIIITLIILIFQTWMLNKQVVVLQKQTKAGIDASRAESHVHFYDILLKLDEVFVQKPEIRKYFYEGVPLEKNSPQYSEAEAVAELMLDIMEHMLWQATLFPEFYVHQQHGERIWDELHVFILEMFVSSPLLREYLEKRRDWFPPQLINKMEQAKRILNQKNNASGS